MQQPEISIHPLIGRLQWKYRIYTLFTPLEDRIGIVEIIIDKGVGEKSYAFCISRLLPKTVFIIMQKMFAVKQFDSKHFRDFLIFFGKADIRNPLSLLAHERSRFATCQWELLTPTDISIPFTHRLVLCALEAGECLFCVQFARKY